MCIVRRKAASNDEGASTYPGATYLLSYIIWSRTLLRHQTALTYTLPGVLGMQMQGHRPKPANQGANREPRRDQGMEDGQEKRFGASNWLALTHLISHAASVTMIRPGRGVGMDQRFGFRDSGVVPRGNESKSQKNQGSTSTSQGTNKNRHAQKTHERACPVRNSHNNPYGIWLFLHHKLCRGILLF